MTNPKPIRILHVVFSLEPGGMENGVVNLSRFLPPQYESWICCLDRKGAFAERLPDPEKCIVLDGNERAGFSWDRAKGLAQQIRKLRPHVLHTHNLGPLIYASLARLTSGMPPILHGEHSALSDEDLTPRRILQRKLLVAGCRRVHTVGTAQMEQWKQLDLPAKRLYAIPNGVDTSRFLPGDKPAARQKIPTIKPDSMVLGMVGRFGPHKRHSILIEAFSALHQKFPNTVLLLVGDGGPEKETALRLVANSPASAAIHWAGFQQDTVPFYQAMDLLVVPSENEGLSNAVLEAMACGVPVLANRTCGMEEVITHAKDGHIADLKDAATLTKTLEQIVQSPQKLLELGIAATETIEKSFSIHSMVQQYAALYDQVSGTTTPAT